MTTMLSDAPYVPVADTALQEIIKALKLEPHSVLYDLGCGDGKVLLAALGEHPAVQTVGYEKNLIPYVIAKWTTRKTPIEVRFGNFMDSHLSEATHIYVYLFPRILTPLFIKLKRECRPGTRIVSCDYRPDGIEPDETITLPPSPTGLCKVLYVYVLK